MKRYFFYFSRSFFTLRALAIKDIANLASGFAEFYFTGSRKFSNVFFWAVRHGYDCSFGRFGNSGRTRLT